MMALTRAISDAIKRTVQRSGALSSVNGDAGLGAFGVDTIGLVAVAVMVTTGGVAAGAGDAAAIVAVWRVINARSWSVVELVFVIMS
jgi:hypothetical protein